MRWRVLERWGLVTRQPPATSMTKLGLSAAVLVQARAAHEAEPLTFQDVPTVMGAHPKASFVGQGTITPGYMMPKLGSRIRAAVSRPSSHEG